MATKYGLSPELGPMTYSDEEDEVFLGRSVTQHKHVSEDTARKIDEVVRGVIDTAYNRARDLLTTNIEKLHTMAEGVAAIRNHRRRTDHRDHGRPRARSAEGLDEAASDKGPSGNAPVGKRESPDRRTATQH